MGLSEVRRTRGPFSIISLEYYYAQTQPERAQDDGGEMM